MQSLLNGKCRVVTDDALHQGKPLMYIEYTKSINDW